MGGQAPGSRACFKTVTKVTVFASGGGGRQERGLYPQGYLRIERDTPTGQPPIVDERRPGERGKRLPKDVPRCPRLVLNRSYLTHSFTISSPCPTSIAHLSAVSPIRRQFIHHFLTTLPTNRSSGSARPRPRDTNAPPCPGQRAGDRSHLKLPGAGWCRVTIAKITRPPPVTISLAQNHSFTTGVVNTFVHKKSSQ